MKRARSGGVFLMPFCRHNAVLRIEKRVFFSLPEYSRVSRIIQQIFFTGKGLFDVKEWCPRGDSNTRHKV